MSVVHINNNLKQTLEDERIVCMCGERVREREHAKVKKEYIMP